MAENSLFIATATILQLFDISAAKDSSGNDIPPDFDWASGFFSSVNFYINEKWTTCLES